MVYDKIRNLDCFNLLSFEVKKIADSYNQIQYYSIQLNELDSQCKTFIDTEFKKLNLPAISWEDSVIFKRRSRPTINLLDMHVDWYRHNNDLIKTSLILPIDGCKNTVMYWADGNYKLEVKKTLDGVLYYKVVWKSIPKIIEKVEIYSFPIICRVDIPHGVTTLSDNSYRLTLALKLDGNPTFESSLQFFKF